MKSVLPWAKELDSYSLMGTKSINNELPLSWGNSLVKRYFVFYKFGRSRYFSLLQSDKLMAHQMSGRNAHITSNGPTL